METRMETRMVMKLAWSYSLKTGCDYEELYSEAVLGWFEAVRKFDESKGVKLTSFAYSVISWKLKDLVAELMTTRHHDTKMINFISNDTENSVDENLIFHPGNPISELLEQMSDSAKEVSMAVLSAPAEYLSMLPKMARGKIKNELREKGWSWPRINRTIQEIKQVLSA